VEIAFAKMYQLLEVLVRRRPGAVTNEELDEILWPQVYVARTSLTRLVSELRAVLGDTPRDSRIIRTIYKSGYAFCAPATLGAVGPAALSGLCVSWDNRQMLLVEGENIAGRGAECSLVIDAETVSRRHARITLVRGVATIEDLGSTNGTYLNGSPISSATPIESGDEIALGTAVLRIRARDSASPTVIVTGATERRGQLR
jgi:hypothetical protein